MNIETKRKRIVGVLVVIFCMMSYVLFFRSVERDLLLNGVEHLPTILLHTGILYGSVISLFAGFVHPYLYNWIHKESDSDTSSGSPYDKENLKDVED